MKFRYFATVLILLPIFSRSQNGQLPSNGNEPYIQQNKGQIKDQYWNPRPDIKYKGTCGLLDFFIRKTGISYQISQLNGDPNKNFPNSRNRDSSGTEGNSYTIQKIDVNWINANQTIQFTTDNEQYGLDHYYNVARGMAPALDMRRYSKLTAKNVWPGVDLTLHFKNGQLEMDWQVQDPESVELIQFEILGAQIHGDSAGNLLMTTAMGTIKENALIISQGEEKLEGHWVIEGNRVSISIKNYKPGIPIFIDPPTQLWGTYFGGNHVDYFFNIDIDNNGQILAAGSTNSPNDIAITGAFQTIFGGGVNGGYIGDALAAKFSTNGQRIWSTYYGGNGGERAYAGSVDADNNFFITGLTYSDTGIATSGTYMDTLPAGNRNAFLAKFTSNGYRVWGTYMGGEEVTEVYSCAADDSLNVYIVGWTRSSIGISTAGSQQPVYGLNGDGFIMKFNRDGDIIWGRYLGGHGSDRAHTCTIDDEANLYIVGNGGSYSEFGYNSKYITNLIGSMDAFLMKMDSSGNVVWSTYFGGTSWDEGHGCVIDRFGDIIISGFTKSTNGIGTPNVFKDTLTGNQDFFLAKFSSGGYLRWSTYYGGILDEWAFHNSCAADNIGNIYLFGQTISPDNIASNDAFNTSNMGNQDGMIAKFNGSGQRTWGTYFLGHGYDYPYDAICDKYGSLYIAGSTGSWDSVVMGNVHQTTYGGGNDAFLIRFQTNASNGIQGTQKVCIGTDPNILTGPSYSTGGYTYRWIKSTTDSISGYQLAGGNDSAANYTPGSQTNTTWYRRILSQNNTHDTSNAIMVYIILPVADWSMPSDSLCLGDSLNVLNRSRASHDTLAIVDWYWNNSLLNHNVDLQFLPDKIGTDSLKMIFISVEGCIDSIKTLIYTFPKPIPIFTQLDTGRLCPGTSKRLFVSCNLAGTIDWIREGITVDTSVDSVYFADNAGTYWVKVTSPVGCISFSDSVILNRAIIPIMNWSQITDTSCSGYPFSFEDLSKPDSFKNRLWSVDNTLLDTGVIFRTNIQNTAWIKYRLYHLTHDNCLDSLVDSVYLKPGPIMDSISGTFSSLVPDSLYHYTFHGNSIISYHWQLNNGILQNGDGTPNIDALWNDTSSGFIQMIAANTDKCFDTLRINVNINQSPLITSFSPNHGTSGDTIILIGYNFNHIQFVSIGNTAVSNFNILSNKSISAIVGLGSDGNVLVKSMYGQDEKGYFEFTGLGLGTKSNSEVLFYPNPVHQALNIKIPAGLLPLTYTLYSGNGQILNEGVLNLSEETLDFTNLPNGLYFIRINGICYRLIKN